MTETVLGYLPVFSPIALQDLANVNNSTTPANGDVLLWSTTTSKWTPATAPGGGVKNNYSATVDPTVNDDADDSYSVGSSWVNTSTERAYVCLDTTVGAAVWKEITPIAQANLSASSVPTTGDDSNDGYAVGSVWVDTTADKAYICTDPSVGAAVWEVITPETLSNLGASVAPTVNDDSSGGYTPGSIWADTTADEAYVCVDASVGAAAWVKITGGSAVQNNYAAVADPTTTDDSGSGYSVGSMWINTNNGLIFACTDASVGAAVWSNLNPPLEGFVAARASTQTYTNNTTTTMSNYAAPRFTVGSPSAFDNSTGVYTVPSDGQYFVFLNASFSPTGTTSSSWVVIMSINDGATEAPFELRVTGGGTSSSFGMSSVSTVFNLTSGGSVYSQVFQSTGGDISADATDDACTFGVMKLRVM